MIGRLQGLAGQAARRRVAARLNEIEVAELPVGLRSAREGDAVVIRGRGLARLLAFDPRLTSLWRRS